MVRKVVMAYNLFLRIITFTWGPLARRLKLLYSTIVRPIIIYRSQIWGFSGEGSELFKEILKPLKLA